MGRKEDNIKKATEVMHDLPQIRNLCIAAHIDHGKTTLSDNLIAGAGMMSSDLAGAARVLDFDEQESARGITINAASASMVHTYESNDFLINLIDTPGHVDFGGDVTRAMRAVDGCFILACAVEGPMPQTETVVRQALKEKVKPVLFINKVDRLINELQVTPEDMMARFQETIKKVNKLIRQFAPEEFRKSWQVDVAAGTVAFGSAYHNWGITVPYMQKSASRSRRSSNTATTRTRRPSHRRLPSTRFCSTWPSLNCPAPFRPSPTVSPTSGTVTRTPPSARPWSRATLKPNSP